MKSYHKPQVYCVAGTVLILGCRSYPWCHFTGEGTESQRGPVTSQVRLCPTIMGPEPALRAVRPSSLSCLIIRTALSTGLAFFQPSALKLMEDVKCHQLWLRPSFGTSVCHGTEFGKWCSGNICKLLLMPPEGVLNHVLTALITGLSVHLHFQTTAHNTNRRQLDGAGATIFQVTLQKLSPKLPSQLRHLESRGKDGRPWGPSCLEVGSSLYVRRTGFSWPSALGCICHRDICISGIEQCNE